MVQNFTNFEDSLKFEIKKFTANQNIYWIQSTNENKVIRKNLK